MASVLTNGDNLPGLISSELREREPVRHFHRVFILRRRGQRHPSRKNCSNKYDCPDKFVLHAKSLCRTKCLMTFLGRLSLGQAREIGGPPGIEPAGQIGDVLETGSPQDAGGDGTPKAALAVNNQ